MNLGSGVGPTRMRDRRSRVALLTHHAVNLELATGVLTELPVEELPCTAAGAWCGSLAPVAGGLGVSGVHPRRTMR